MSTIKVNNLESSTGGGVVAKLASVNGGGIGTKNLVINGAMIIQQKMNAYTSGGQNLTGIKTTDRFRGDWSGTDNSPTQIPVDVAAGTTPYSLGFRKCFKIINGNQTSGAGASDFVGIDTILEAQDIATSGWNYTSASSFVTLSFWVKSSVAQNFYGYLFTSDGTSQNYPFETGSLTADTWTKITKTIPGNSNLTFNNDNGAGLQIQFWAYLGTSYTGTITLNQWGAFAGATRTPDNTSTWYTTDDATFEITGVQLEVGSVATDFEHLSFANELTRCERYYQLIAPSVAEALISDTVDYDNTTYFTCDLHTPMRIAPSLVVGNHTDAFRLYGTNPRNVNTLLANTGVTTTSKILLYATGGSSGAVGFARIFKNTSGNQSGGTYATIAVNAEL